MQTLCKSLISGTVFDSSTQRDKASLTYHSRSNRSVNCLWNHEMIAREILSTQQGI